MIFLKRHKKYCHTTFRLYINELNVGIVLVRPKLYYTLSYKIGNLYFSITSNAIHYIDKSITIYNKKFYINIVDDLDINGNVRIRYIHYTKKNKLAIKITLSNSKFRMYYGIEDGDYETYYEDDYTRNQDDLMTNKSRELEITPQHKQSMQKHLLYDLV